MASRETNGNKSPEILAAKHRYCLNPYPEFRISSCPECGSKTGQRKVPILIHIDPGHFVAINYTHRFCAWCDILYGHKHEIEHMLAESFAPENPEIVGNEYMIVGTVDKKIWRENMKKPGIGDPDLYPFRGYEELRMTQGGWFREGQEPPVVSPRPSTEWVKSNH